MDNRFCGYPPLAYEVSIDGITFPDESEAGTTYMDMGSTCIAVLNQFLYENPQNKTFRGLFFYNKATLYVDKVEQVGPDVGDQTLQVFIENRYYRYGPYHMGYKL